MPVAAEMRPGAVFERSVPRGRAILHVDNVELAGLEWSWIKLRLDRVEPGVAGERKVPSKPDSITEIEITAPRE